MRDEDRVAGDFGRQLGAAISAASLSVEAGVMINKVHAVPVRFVPSYAPFDPLHTLRDRDQDRVVPATLQESWSARRLLIPAEESEVLPGVVLAGLAGCDGPLSFEAILSREGVSLYLVAPPEQLSFFADAWQVHYPAGLSLPATDPLQDLPRLAVLYDLHSPVSYDRLITAASSFWGQLCRVAGMLGKDDVLVYQVVFSPLREPWQRNIAALSHGQRSRTEAKRLDEPLFGAVVRIAATSHWLAGPLGAFVGHFTSAGLPLSARSLRDYRAVLSRDQVLASLKNRSSHALGLLLTSSELGAFVHPPHPDLGAVFRLPVVQGLPVPEGLRGDDGMPLGMNADRGEEIIVRYPITTKYNLHASFTGTSGGGKSTFLTQLIRSLALQGIGCCFLDPHQQTADRLPGVLGDVEDRVVRLSFNDDLPVAYTPFTGVAPEDIGLVTGDFVQIIGPLLGTEGFRRLEHILSNGIYALFALELPLAKLPLLYARSRDGERLRSEILRVVRHEPVLQFWRDEYPSFAPSVFAPISNRFSGLFLDDRTFRTFNQATNAVDLAEFMRDGKIVIVSLPTNWEAARIVGGFMIGTLKHLAMRRPNTARPFFLIVDEFHRFEGAAFHEILEQTTKGRLSLWLAHQSTSQVPTALAKSIQGIDQFVFRINNGDAKHYAGLLDNKVVPETLVHLPPGAVYARIGNDVVNFQAPPPLDPDPELAERIVAASRERYYQTTIVPAGPLPARQGRIIDTY